MKKGRFYQNFERHYKPKGMGLFWKLIILILIVLFFLYIVRKDLVLSWFSFLR